MLRLKRQGSNVELAKMGYEFSAVFPRSREDPAATMLCYQEVLALRGYGRIL